MFYSSIRKNRKIVLSFLIFTLLWANACAKSPQEQSPPTSAPTIAVSREPTALPALSSAVLAWPDDEAIAYCPVFSDAQPFSVSKQDGNQAKAYVLKFEGIDVQQYLSYMEQFESSQTVSIDANTNLRDNAYSLNAHKSDDAYMMIRVVYTRSTQSLVISVTYAHPSVTSES